MADEPEYCSLTPKMAWLLAAPHTWAASIFPVLVAMAFAFAEGHAVSVTASAALLAISVLLQSAVNTINDYFDYVKGTDSADDNVEADDAVLVYNNVNPKSARNLAVGFIAAAFALGIYCVWYAGWVPLVVALVGVAVIFMYSGGKTPISYLPVGEAASGVVMGALITFASYTVLARSVEWLVLVWSIPLVIGIALIMLTNNTCDIEKDVDARRRTLPSLIGREKSRALYRALVLAWYACVVVIVAAWFTRGIVVAPAMMLATYPVASALLKNPLVASSRIAAMSQVCSMNIAMGAFFAAMVFASGVPLAL